MRIVEAIFCHHRFRCLRKPLRGGPGHLNSNEALKAKFPKFEALDAAAGEDDDDEVKALTREQEARLLDAAKGERLEALWHLLLNTGLRPGEAYALKWHHIDREARLVHVRGTLVRVRGEKRWKVNKPKTKRGKRSVPISARTLELLDEWKARQDEERRRMGAEWRDSEGFVFTTEVGSPLGNNMGRAWDRLLQKADGGSGDFGGWGPEPEKPKSGPTPERTFTPHFSIYVLRHTFATLALKGDRKLGIEPVPLLEVSRLLGHFDVAFTAKVYGHVKAEDAPAASDAFERRQAAAQGLRLVA